MLENKQKPSNPENFSKKESKFKKIFIEPLRSAVSSGRLSDLRRALGLIKKAPEIEEKLQKNKQESSRTPEYIEEMNFLTSENVFPEKTKKDIENLKFKIDSAIKILIDFAKKHESTFLNIKELKEEENQKLDDNSTDEDDFFNNLRKKNYPLNISNAYFIQTELIKKLSKILPQRGELFVGNELNCKELIEIQKKYYTLLNNIKEKLGSKSTVFDAKSNLKELERTIEVDSITISEQISSHVTGYDDMISILNNGQLLSKGAQLKENKKFHAKVTSKADEEVHQIVFDRNTFRPEYSAPEGKPKVPPVIFMTSSSFLLSNYQGMESDGWHTFGKNHDAKSGVEDNFSLGIGNPNLVIMVPIEYQIQLRNELESMTSENESIDELEKRMNIFYIPIETYKDVKNKKLYSSQDYQLRPELKQTVYSLAKEHLPKQALQRGRLVPSGNIGDGSATYDKKLYNYVVANKN